MSSESARMLGTVLTEASIRAAVAAALAGAILTVARTRAPGVRHAIWTAITLAMLAMPLLPRALPAVRVAVPQPIELWPDAAPPAGVSMLPVAAPADRAMRVSGPTAAPPVTDGRVSSPPASRQIDWPAALAYLYLTGLLGSLLYVGAGWLAMTAIVRRSRPIALADGSVVHASAIVAAPLTAGVFRPRIILPANWRAWPAETLRAVITHERTHIRRRDPVIALAARVNRCVFWFHPLSWWLESKLATVAEFACDETASRACRAPAEYAQMLVEIAEDVRRHGGRLAWQGIAASGNGQLTDRIERLLAGAPWPAASRGKKALVACACVLAVAIAAACRPAAHAEALKPDPALTARRAEQNARAAREYAARAIAPEQVAQLESTVARNPEDLESRERLLRYYGDFQRRLEAPGMAARRAHVLWMIEHRPDRDIAGSTRLPATNQDPNPDPTGYAQAKRLWLAHMAKPGATVQTLTNAARFFEVADRPLAETAYLKAAEREPGESSRRARAELGRIYALAIMGSDASMPLNVLRHVSMSDAHSPYAQQVRKKLEESADVQVLTSAGWTLVRARQFNRTGQTAGSIDFDVHALGMKYLERALELDPLAMPARLIVPAIRSHERSERVLLGLKGVSPDAMPQAVAALPETDRLDVLWRLISDAYNDGENLRKTGKAEDRAGSKAAWQRLSLYADQAWGIGPRHPEHPMAAAAMFNAHIYLGTVALWDGDVRTALSHLKAAPDVVTSDSLRYNGDPASNRLVRYLLKAGERDAVIAYCERLARINIEERKSLNATAQAIRAGRMPEWYQLLTEGEAGR